MLWLDDDESEQLISSLSSETARSVLTALHESPATASELSEEVDTSLQNVRHHLSNLREADLVREVGTRYSVKGREMTVYGPADDSLVVCVGREDDRSSFLDSLKRLVGTVAVLGVFALLVDALFDFGFGTVTDPGAGPRIGDAVGGAGGPPAGLLSPAVAVVLGGLLVLGLLAAWEFRR
jgi:DNA-binding transcriptional ArsR family regulator